MADDLRPLTQDDLDWVVAITRARRERLVPHAPRFWRPAADATTRHRAFLAHLIDDAATTAVRTDRGYAIALDRGAHLLVDDMVVDDGAWATEGMVLLESVLGVGRPVRFVAPAFEHDRRAAAEAVGLEPEEAWWHRDLPVTQVEAEGAGVQLTAPGATGRLVPAPPVYDPGGPVLLVADVESPEALGALEREAARRGATVAVVSRTAARGDVLAPDPLLTGAGYTLTTVFYAGPRPAA